MSLITHAQLPPARMPLLLSGPPGLQGSNSHFQYMAATIAALLALVAVALGALMGGGDLKSSKLYEP
jgi:hypothetical protein